MVKARYTNLVMKVIKLNLLILLLFFLTKNVYSHGGRTNSKGCHNNRKTGDFHCHNSKVKPRPLSKRNQKKFKCENKRICADMINCNEAKFYLKNCGLHRLDGDKDGIPCESICGG